MAGYLKTADGRECRVGEIEHPIQCFRCGICCTRYQPRLTAEEVYRLAAQLAVSTDEFLSRYITVTVVGYLLRQSEKGCIFLTWEEGETRASCSIYPFRPQACRDWVPSLSRPECQEGLARLKTRNRIMLVNELYPSPEAIERFCSSLR